MAMNDSYDISEILDQDDGFGEIYEGLDLSLLRKGANDRIFLEEDEDEKERNVPSREI
jgi:hypothetical protein